MKKLSKLSVIIVLIVISSIFLYGCNNTEMISNEYKISIKTNGDGTITKAPHKSSYKEGKTITLNAIPDDGWIFNQWKGDITGTTNPIDITIDEDMNIIANFKKLENTIFEIPENDNLVIENISNYAKIVLSGNRLNLNDYLASISFFNKDSSKEIFVDYKLKFNETIYVNRKKDYIPSNGIGTSVTIPYKKGEVYIWYINFYNSEEKAKNNLPAEQLQLNVKI